MLNQAARWMRGSIFPIHMSSDKRRVYYHVTLQPHRRLPALYAEVETFVRELMGEMTQDTEFTVLEVGAVPTHIHLLIEKAPGADLIVFIRDFQDKSSKRIFSKFPELARDMKTDRFWTDGGFQYERHTATSLSKVRHY